MDVAWPWIGLSFSNFNSNNNIFNKALWDLLFILSKWIGIVGSHRKYGLCFELGVYSPSDCKHTFRDFHLEENYPYQEIKDMEREADAYKLRIDRFGLDNLNDPYHGWVNGRREGVNLEAKQRIMGTLSIEDNLPQLSIYPYKFPRVDIVTALSIRRQFYRKIAAKSLDKLLRESFTCLRALGHETWRDVDPQQQLCYEKGTL